MTHGRAIASRRDGAALALVLACSLAWTATCLRGETVLAEVAARPEQATDEYTAKAAFLYKFARYAKWPESAFRDKDSPLRVAVFGEDPFGRALDEVLKDKRIGPHPLACARFRSLADLDDCHLLFVPNGSAAELERIRQHYKDQPVLIVGDSLAAAEEGAVIGLYLERSKVRFAVNTESLRRSSLELSSELLKLAKLIEKPAGSGEPAR